MFDKNVRGVRLYSVTLVTLLLSLSSWLTLYSQAPEKADMNQFQQIVQDVQQISNDTVINMDNQETKLMAWLYPGEPACDALSDAEKVELDVIKPEYFLVDYDGQLKFLTADTFACNGYSVENVNKIKKLSKEQFVTISSRNAQVMDEFLKTDNVTGEHTDRLVDFVLTNDFTGIEIDFEDYGGWSEEVVARYLAFLTRLGDDLHGHDKQLMIDLPPVSNQTEADWYKFKLSDFDNLPVDYVVIMAYDYQFDHGAGQPVSPLDWLREVVEFTKSQVADDKKIVIGLPSYGYKGETNTMNPDILTYDQASEDPLFAMLKRNAVSGELMAFGENQVLVAQDQQSLRLKIQAVNSLGIYNISIWHLGGNQLP